MGGSAMFSHDSSLWTRRHFLRTGTVAFAVSLAGWLVSIAPQRFFSPSAHAPGFLGPRYAPLLVADGQRALQEEVQNTDQQLRVQNLETPGASPRRMDERRALLGDLEEDFLAARPGPI